MSDTQEASRSGVRVRVQQFGTFLSNMVMPNIGAFIAWGFLTALFIETGWLPNEQGDRLIGTLGDLRGGRTGGGDHAPHATQLSTTMGR